MSAAMPAIECRGITLLGVSVGNLDHVSGVSELDTTRPARAAYDAAKQGQRPYL